MLLEKFFVSLGSSRELEGCYKEYGPLRDIRRVYGDFGGLWRTFRDLKDVYI